MKKECDIVKDLLFSYNDGVLSTTSKEFVENHLKTCEDCNNALKEIKQESDKKNKSKMQHEKDNIDFFKSVKKKMTKKNIIISIGLFILLIIIIFNALIFYKYNQVASTMTIYLQDDITEEQLENIKNKIIDNSSNLELTYISKEKALEEAKDWGDQEIVNFLDEYTSGDSNNPFLASIEVKVNSSKEVQELSKIVQNMPGVSSIYSYIEWNPYEFFIASVLQNK